MWKKYYQNITITLLLWVTVISTFAIGGGDRYKAAHEHFGNKGWGTSIWVLITIGAVGLFFFLFRLFKGKK